MAIYLFILFFAFANAHLFNLLKSSGSDVIYPKPHIEPKHNDEIAAKIKNVVDVVSMVHKMPACNKIATSMLMNSCSSPLETTSNVFDSLGTLYGTRLAVCELYNAGADIPTACVTFVPALELVRKVTINGLPGAVNDPRMSYNSYDAQTTAASKRCTHALFQTPQSWTSFSNSKQNSMAICQAMRVEIDKDQLIDILADVKLQSVEFNETAHISLLALQKLHDLAVLTNKQYADSNADVLKATEELVNRLKNTTNDMTELSLSTVDTSMAMAGLEMQFDSMMREVMAQVNSLGVDAAEAQADLNRLGNGLSVVSKQLEHTQQTVMLMEKTTLAYAASLEDKFSFLQNIPEPAMQLLQKSFELIAYLTTDAPRLYKRVVKAATAFAVAWGSAIAAYPFYRYKEGFSMLKSLSASIGFGMAYSAFYALLSHGIGILEEGDARIRPGLMIAAVALASAGAGIGILLSRAKRGDPQGDSFYTLVQHALPVSKASSN